MVSKYFIALNLFLGLISIKQIKAQELPKLTTEEGLSSNKINDLLQDDMGFLWIATADGLNRFDGVEMVQYFYSKMPGYLPDNCVHCMQKLARGWLAI